MATLRYTTGLIVCILIVGFTTSILFQNSQRSLTLAFEMSVILLGGFGGLFCFFGLLSQLFNLVARLSAPQARQRQIQKQATEIFETPVASPPSYNPPPSNFAQALKERRNLSYDEIRRKNEFHRQQITDRLKVDRTDRQQRFARWNDNNMSDFHNISHRHDRRR